LVEAENNRQQSPAQDRQQVGRSRFGLGSAVGRDYSRVVFPVSKSGSRKAPMASHACPQSLSSPASNPIFATLKSQRRFWDGCSYYLGTTAERLFGSRAASRRGMQTG
jgi:hypothetical protein